MFSKGYVKILLVCASVILGRAEAAFGDDWGDKINQIAKFCSGSDEEPNQAPEACMLLQCRAAYPGDDLDVGNCVKDAEAKFVADSNPPSEISTAAATNTCGDSLALAKKTCSNPIDAMMNDDSKGSNAAILSGAMQMFTGSASGGLEACTKNVLANVGNAGLNAGFGVKCKTMIEDCETACSDTTSTEAKKNKSQCTGLGIYVKKYAADTAAYGQNSQAASAICEQMAQAAQASQNMFGRVDLPAGMDCTNPINALACAGGLPGVVPGGQGGGYGSPGGSAAADGSGKGGLGDANGFNVLGLDGATPGKTTGGAAPAENKNAGVANGGGQMLNSNGGGGGGQNGNDRDRSGGQPAGRSADVLQGERGGGGYSQAGGFNPGGGWGGYGAQGGSGSSKSAFDLSKFLPGQKNAHIRGPAGLRRPSAEVAPMYDDIFKKISDRVQVVCRTNRLMDCK
jgi:hypothetical protein